MTRPEIPELILKFAQRNCAGEPSDVSAVRLQQKGVMRMAPHKPWAPFRADQVISSRKVEFEWTARIKLAPFLWAKVIDAYREKHGRLKASIWGIIPMANAQGPSIDQAEIQRYLAELPWCPCAFLNNSELNFKIIRKNTVRVWYGDEQTYIDLNFDGQGDIVSTRSETREREGFGCQPWIGRFDEYREIGGLRVPLRATVKWETPSGPFEYWKGMIVSSKVFTDVLAGE